MTSHELTAARYQQRMSEAQMRDGIVPLVQRLGGHAFYVRDSRHAPETEHMLDLQLILPHRQTLAIVELKSMRRQLTDGQSIVLEALRECTRCETFLVRPEPRGPEETAYNDFVNWLGGVP